jgi:outer membrane protein assembly factor BamB
LAAPLGEPPFIIAANNDQHAVDCISVADGKRRWQEVLPGEKSTFIGTPVLADLSGDGAEQIFVGDGENNLHCLSAKDGKSLWSLEAPYVTAPVTMAVGDKDGGCIIVLCGDKTLRCFDLKTRKERWQFASKDGAWGEALLADANGDKVADVLCAFSDGTLYCLSGVDGKVLWQFTFSARPMSYIRRPFALMQLDANQPPTVVCASPDGRIYFLGLANGKERARAEIGEPVYSTPVLLADGETGGATLFVTTMGRRVACLSLSPQLKEQEQWSFTLGGPMRFSAPLLISSPARVLVATGPPENSLVCLSAATAKSAPRKWWGPWPTQR